MNLEIINNVFNDVRNKFVNGFLTELNNYIKRENQNMNNITDNNKIITKYRDKMLIERNQILNNYAKQTEDKGQMYYIYSNNSKIDNAYNLFECVDGKSHTVIEEDKKNLPDGAELGSVLRKKENSYILDEEATIDIAKKLRDMEEYLLKEQDAFLEANRIEGHIYEVSEKSNDRVWLFDITSGSNEGIEEIDFPENLLDDAKEGNLFIYTNGEYHKE